MAQNTPDFLHELVTEDYRVKAEVKFQIKQLESRLNHCVSAEHKAEFFPARASTLCHDLAHKYLDYLTLIGGDKNQICSELFLPRQGLTWQKQYQLILHLRQQLVKASHGEQECQLIMEIASLYFGFNQLTPPPVLSNTVSEDSERLKNIFREEDLQSWLMAVVDFWNERTVQSVTLLALFHEWAPQQLQVALDYFSAPELISLANAIFFYKLYPDKLFKELIHPEKLVSVRARVGLLHHYIEQLESHLHRIALQQGLKPEVDYLFHGDELPQGIMIEVDEEFKEIIQSVIKKVKVKYTYESEEQVNLERLHDLRRAYKFWFNPNRLIDAVMVLQQRLVKEDVAEENKPSMFRQKMVLLYEQLSTTECLDLYGYFANHDSRYLLYTLFLIKTGHFLDWLPALNSIEKNAITQVFQALQCVMEALRDELKIRHVVTEPYVYDLAKQHIHTGRRNRDAVFRIIAIYGSETVIRNDTVERLFNLIENTGHEPKRDAK